MLHCRSKLSRRAMFAPLALGVLFALLALPATVLAQRAADLGGEPPNAALEALRASNPTTPAELVRAIGVAVNFDRYDEADFYLAKLLELELEFEDLVALQAEFGTAPFLSLARDAEFNEDGRVFATQVIEAAHAYATDPARLQEMVNQLNAPNAEVRAAALAGLVQAEGAAVGPLMAAMADRTQYPETERYQAALVQVGQPAVAPLIAALASDDEALQAAAIEVLGRLGDGSALVYLVRPLLDPAASAELRAAAVDAFVRLNGEVPSAASAERYLAQQAQTYYAGEAHFRTDENNLARVWRWIEGRSVPVLATPAVANRIVASDLTRDLYRLHPENIAYRRMYLAAMLENEKSRVGLAKSLPRGEGTAAERAAAEGNAALVDMLEVALAEQRPIAAAAVCEVLGDSGDLSLLDSVNGQKSALVQALSYPDRRLQFFAAQAILKLEPTEPFAGSDDLTFTLGYIGSTAGERRALVAGAHSEHLHHMAGMLNALGYTTESSGTGRDLMLEAIASPDVEFVLLGTALDNGNVGEVLQMLRKDPRTAALPVGIYVACEPELARMERLAGDFQPAIAFPLPVEEATVIEQSSRLLALADENFVPATERVAMARAALAWLRELAANPQQYGFYNVLVQEQPALAALGSLETSLEAAQLLGYLATPAAQTALVDLASQNTQPLAVRQAAAEAFAVAVANRGLLLTTDQILLQYERYNLSETLDRETQAVLGSVLDTIEAPTASAE